jgi:hypothetical protein
MSSQMESTPTAKTGKGATFSFVLGTFAVFAVLMSVIQAFNGTKVEDPRASDRLAFSAEIVKGQKEIMSKAGLDNAAKLKSAFEKTALALKSKAPAVSKMVIPGSPTQLKATAAPVAPAAAPAAPTK